MQVEVVYAQPGVADAVRLSVPPGTTVLHAIHASGLLERHPEIDLLRQRVGIYGRVVSPHELLTNGDRVEIYRPLAQDPKEARRRRAVKRR